VFTFPRAAEPLLSAFSVAFSARTFQRVVLLMLGAILSLRRRTISAILTTLGPLAPGHWSDYSRVLCRACWSLWPLGRVLAAMILELIPKDQAVVIPVDDTTPQHKGKRVYGKGRHHDAIRSTHSHTVWVYGHKWVVLAINVKFPFASRPWALPVVCALYRSRELNQAERHRHKTPIQLARQLVAVLIHWFPERKFILVGDGGYASHELARFCHRHRRHVTLVSRFHPKANLYDPPPTKHSPQGGRPRLKGRKRAAPNKVVKNAKRKRCTVSWYGGQSRRVELVSGTGHWYKSGDGLVPVRWIFVHDVQGTHRDEYLYSTDPTLTPTQLVSLFTGRWNIEVTFQEVRTHLGLTTPRNWSKKSVLRTAPCLFGLLSVVSLIFAHHTGHHRNTPLSTPWYTKKEATFSDAITAVRRLCWETVLKGSPIHAGVSKLPRRVRLTLLDHLSRAA
jgi:DDE superfamily endonuclease